MYVFLINKLLNQAVCMQSAIVICWMKTKNNIKTSENWEPKIMKLIDIKIELFEFWIQ